MNNSLTAYHGTRWQRPLFPSEAEIDSATVFNNLSTEYNDFKVFFMSNNEEVCRYFSDDKSNFDTQNFMNAIVKISVDDQAITESCRFTFRENKEISYKGEKYNYFDEAERTSLYEKLREDKVQIFVMKDDYMMNDGTVCGDDIAVLDTSVISAIEVRLKIKGQWGEFMNYEEASKILEQWCYNEELNDEDFDFADHDHINDYLNDSTYDY